MENQLINVRMVKNISNNSWILILEEIINVILHIGLFHKFAYAIHLSYLLKKVEKAHKAPLESLGKIMIRMNDVAIVTIAIQIGWF